MSVEGGSAGEKARSLRAQAIEARARADRLDSMAQNWEAGEVGEQRVAAVLRPIEGPHCYVYHDRFLRPGRSKVNLDHIVISAAGCYLIDAKNWSGDVRVAGGSVHQECDGRSHLRDRELDKVQAMAAEMQLLTSTFIEPVICLTGERAESFGPAQYVRGVYVVPVGQLAAWLLARPRPPAGVDLRTLAVSIAATFPSAMAPAFLSVPPPRRHVGSRPPTPRPNRAPRSRSTRRKSSDAQGLLTGLVVLVACLVASLTTFGHGLIRSATNAYVKAIAQPTSAQAQSRTWVHPCSKLTDSEVSKIAGVHLYRYINGTNDACTWGLRPKTTTYEPGVLRIETGWSAKYRTASAKPVYTDTPGSIGLSVPQLLAVPGSKSPAGATTQPIYVGLTYAGTKINAAKAKQIITALAAATARQLPTGPGATEIHVR